MAKISAILQGWKNYTFHNPEMEIKAKQRAQICAGCKYAVKGSYQQLMPDYSLQDVQGMKCNICECPLSTKLRQDLESCPKNKW